MNKPVQLGKHAAVSSLLAAGGVVSLCALMQWGRAQNHSFLLVLLFTAAALMGGRLFRLEDRRLRRYSLLFGFLFGLAQLLGYRLEAAGTLGGPLLWLLPILCACCFAPALGEAFAFLLRLIERRPRDAAARRSGRAVFWLYAGIVLLGWLPVFLAYYPGIFGYDVLAQIPQVQLGQYSAHHPLLHTLLLGGFYLLGGALGSYTAGIAAYTVFQMVVIALCIAYALVTLYRERCPRWARLSALALFAVMPFYSMIAVASTKDPLFSAMLLLLATFLFQGYRKQELWTSRVYLLKIALTVFAVCALRNNGLPAVAAGTLLLAWAWKDRVVRRRFAGAALSGLVLFGGVSAGLSAALHAKNVNTRESLSVPIQQIVRVLYLHPELARKPEVQALFERTEEYRPNLADPAKRFSHIGMSTLKPFISMWFEYLTQYPAEYADAFLLLTKGYWFLDDVSHAAVYSEDLEDREGYLHSAFRADLGVERRSLFPAMETVYERLFSANEYQQIPLFSAICAPAFWGWALWFILFAGLCLRRYDVWMAGGMLAALFLTLLMGPCCLARYAYPIMLCAPVLFGMLLTAPPASGAELSKTK